MSRSLRRLSLVLDTGREPRLCAIAVALVAICGSRVLPAQLVPSAALRVGTIARGFAVPRGLEFVGSEEMIVTSDRYVIDLLNVRTGARRAVDGGPPRVHPRSSVAETGIFDVALDPAFASNRLVYLSFAAADGPLTPVAVVRARLDGTRLRDTSTLIVAAAWDTSEAHYGGRLAVRDGLLFRTVGERESRARVQDLGTHVGKVLRIHTDGRVPADNPFVTRRGARPEIWTYGHRSAQGIAFDSAGVLWSAAHGPRHGDELNRIGPGRDCGWPRVSFGLEYTGGAVGSGFVTDSLNTMPQWVWTPAIAPSDLLIYSGRAIPQWRGSFLTTSLNASRQHLNRIVWDGSYVVLDQRLFVRQLGRLRSIIEAPDGAIYLGNDAGQILRLMAVPAGAAAGRR